MSLDFEFMMGVAGAEKDQIDHKEFAAIFQLIVPTLQRGMAGGNGRYHLEGSLRARVQVIEGRIIGHYVLQVDVRVGIHGAESSVATLPTGEHGRQRPQSPGNGIGDPMPERMVNHHGARQLLNIRPSSSLLKQFNDFLNRPDIVRDPNFHGWRHTRRRVHPGEVVMLAHSGENRPSRAGQPISNGPITKGLVTDYLPVEITVNSAVRINTEESVG
jgi:hypothetical protein